MWRKHLRRSHTKQPQLQRYLSPHVLRDLTQYHYCLYVRHDEMSVILGIHFLAKHFFLIVAKPQSSCHNSFSAASTLWDVSLLKWKTFTSGEMLLYIFGRVLAGYLFQNSDGKKHKEEYWAAGTGYGHSRRPGKHHKSITPDCCPEENKMQKKNNGHCLWHLSLVLQSGMWRRTLQHRRKRTNRWVVDTCYAHLYTHSLLPLWQKWESSLQRIYACGSCLQGTVALNGNCICMLLYNLDQNLLSMFI